MPEQLSGVIERITFHNLDNGYCVLRVRARGHRDVITVVGTCQQVVAGEYVQAAGEWVTDRQHGEQAIELVKSNPYRLSTDIWGIGFRTADELALKLDIPRDSPFRAQAAVRHVLHEAQGDGHVGFPEELALEAAQELTQIPP